MIAVYRFDVRGLSDGIHTLRAASTDAAGNTASTDPVTFVVRNAAIEIIAGPGTDGWQVTRRKTTTGKLNRLEVDKGVTVRINGVDY